MPPEPEEVVLAGGNMTTVVSVGDTVRRTAGAWTPTIHAFMRHLRAAGFDRVPEPLAIDDRGREIISLLAGAPATAGRAPAHEPAEVVCHNDFAPYNLMFEDGRLTGVIDLDLASPGPRVWDMAYTAYRFVPLTDPANPDAPFPGAREQARRLEAFCAAYGEPGIEPRDVLRAAAAKLRELIAFIERGAAAGDPAQRVVRERGDVAIYARDVAYIDCP